MNVSELVIFPDLLRLPKSDLEDICTNEGIAESGGAFELAKRIWDYADTSEKKQRMFTPYCHKFFAGNTSISWYTCDNLEDLSKHIIEKERPNPFETKIPYEEAKLNTTPKLRSASRISEHSYFLRFIYKDGTRRIIGEDIEVLPTNKTATAFIDELNGIIEVRAKPNDAEKIAEVIAGYARQQLSLHKQNFIKPFGGSIESIADTLGGKLYESKASPELWMDNFGEEENEALLDIFEALSKYFENGDIDKLQECLDNAKEILGGELLSLPFAVLVLAGMGNVGLKVEQKDLRNTTLYKVFKPYLQTSGGYIKFEVEENGVQHEFTMVVGVESQSIYFRSKKTTETVIKKVREKLLLQKLVV